MCQKFCREFMTITIYSAISFSKYLYHNKKIYGFQSKHTKLDMIRKNLFHKHSNSGLLNRKKHVPQKFLSQTICSLKIPLIYLASMLSLKLIRFFSPFFSLVPKNSSFSAISLILLLLSLTSISLSENLFRLLTAVPPTGSTSDGGGTVMFW